MKNGKRTGIRSVAFVLCALLILPCLLASCAGDGDKAPLMTVEYLASVADKGQNTELGDLTRFRYESHGPLFEFPMSLSGYTAWAYYDAEYGVLLYIMLSCDRTDEKLYIFYRDSARLENTQQEYDGPADSSDVYDFIARTSGSKE